MTSLLLITLLALAAGKDAEATVATLDGRAISGAVQSWSAKEISVAATDGVVQLAAGELLDVRWARDIAEATEATSVELIDGTRIPFASFSITKRMATFTGKQFEQPLSVPREAIRLIELRAPTQFVATALEEIERKQAPGDSLVVSQRDSETMDYLTGVIGDVTAEQATFEWDGDRVPVKRTKIAAMVFYQARQPSLPEAVCELSLIDGSRIVASDVSLLGGRLHVTTPAGVALEAPLEQVMRADFSAGKIAYLSDMKSGEVRWTPGLGVPAGWASARSLPRSDQSFSGSPLTLLWKDDVALSRRDVRTYAKGLAVRSRTEITYRLPAGMKRFITTAGMDPDDSGHGNVRLEVRGDDRVLWEGVVQAGQAPVEIDVELGSARRLHLLVDYGEHLDFGDRLHLAEARVTK
ncbi:MAG: NPCBM/NEW2 domain-containing protein [Pirellulales bacterium]|nr:NPCBM/NEW2 domain-containing protein [Pirellulales bacterium]